jgi:hypothetical protein
VLYRWSARLVSLIRWRRGCDGPTVVQESVGSRSRKIHSLYLAAQFIVPLTIRTLSTGEQVLWDVAHVSLDVGEDLDVLVTRNRCISKGLVIVDGHLNLANAALAHKTSPDE